MPTRVIINWSCKDIPSKSYICGYCGNYLASNKGWQADTNIPGTNIPARVYIYICHNCSSPTYFDCDSKQTPGPLIGETVKNIKDESVSKLYDEARKAIGSGGNTAAVLCCRKILMHIAVSEGAKEGKNFLDYVNYLAENSLIPPRSKGWVDYIRLKGNEANHEITIMTPDDAEKLIKFTEMLLKILYEYPASIENSDK